ncbi:MAG: sugar kinase [Candidatus Limnocylindrales bacterium]
MSAPPLTESGPEVVALGECLVAMVAGRPGPLAEARQFDAHVAGSEANVLVGLARLGHPGALVGRVGRDGFGQSVLRRLRSEGVEISGVTIDPSRQTALLVRSRSHVGPAELRYYRTDSAGSRLSTEDVERQSRVIEGARLLHLTGITPALSPSCAAAVQAAIGLARGAGRMISVDVNYRRLLWSEAEARAALLPIVAEADVVIAGPDEAALLIGHADTEDLLLLAGALRALGPGIAVVKAGPEGAVAMGHNGEPVVCPSLPVPTIVDPIGAGDAFTAGLLAAVLEGRSLDEALRWANACGAAAVAVDGDMPGLPTREELERLLSGASGDIVR